MLLSVAACGEPEKVAVHLPIPPERIDCEPMGVSARPELPAEQHPDWSGIDTVQKAYAAHVAFVNSVRAREGMIANYIVEVEGALWQCASDDQWLREWDAELADE